MPSLSNRLLTNFNTLRLDVSIMLGCISLMLMGCLCLYSGSNGHWHIILLQCVRLALGFAVLTIVALCPPYVWFRAAPWLYMIGVILLITVHILGYTGKGAQRWLDLGLFRFEPSEIMKLALPMMLSWFLHQQKTPLTLRTLITCFILILAPTLLILLQPDLGTSILIITTSATVMLLAGLSRSWVIGIFSAIVATIPLAWRHLHAYQKQRILTFMNPEADPLGHGYHIIQSKIAIGSGGLWGKGWLLGTQGHLHFLPEQTTDFIFALWAEEFGFVGTSVLLTICLAITLRMLYISSQAQNRFRRLLSASITMMFFTAWCVNIGMVCGLLPVVGVPLTFVSFGGSSLVTMMAAFGIMMSIHAHRDLMTR